MEYAFSGVGPIPVRDVETTLQRLWQEEGLRGMTRSCTRNLVVVLADRNAVEEVVHRVIAVAKHHPSRFFFIVPDDTTPDPGMAAEVGVQGHLDSARPTCCEVITLYARPDVWEHVHTAILALLLPERPVDIWWQRPLDIHDTLLRQLLDVGTSLVVDAEHVQDVAAFLSALADVRKHASSPSVVDLVWSRLTPWRELLAQLFDPPDKRPYLLSVQRVHIRAVNTTAGTIAALYLTAWLASRLGWTPGQRGRKSSKEWRFHRNGDLVRVSLEFRAPSAQDTHSPLLQRVRLLTAPRAEGTSAEFTISVEGAEEVLIQVEVGTTRTRQTRGVHWSDAVEGLTMLLQQGGEDPIYQDVLDYLVNWKPVIKPG